MGVPIIRTIIVWGLYYYYYHYFITHTITITITTTMTIAINTTVTITITPTITMTITMTITITITNITTITSTGTTTITITTFGRGGKQWRENGLGLHYLGGGENDREEMVWASIIWAGWQIMQRKWFGPPLFGRGGRGRGVRDYYYYYYYHYYYFRGK